MHKILKCLKLKPHLKIVMGAVCNRGKIKQDACYHQSMIMIKRYLTIAISISFFFSYIECEAKQEFSIQGRTMGTTYNVKIVTDDNQRISGLKEEIDARLEAVNRSMSTYQKDSEISRFNRFKETGQKFKISDDFFQVMTTGQTIYRLSEGAWDATVHPLVDLWGFGQGPRKSRIPLPKEITVLLPDVGFSNIEVLAPGYLLKKRAAVTVDLSSIAKGFGVDQVADVLRKKSFEDYLVEIGGEIIAAGHREDGRPWRIGINRPQAGAAFDEVYRVVELRNQAFATSGDYRNFFLANGIRYSHVIDPRTGYPVSNGVVSVSIIADNCTLADGLATAVLVLGVAKGLNLINRLAGVEGLIVVEKNSGTLVDYHSTEFETID